MSPEERALARAREQGVKLRRQPNGDSNTFIASSVSRPGTLHTVTTDGERAIACDCIGWQHGHYCKHAAAVNAALELEKAKQQERQRRETAYLAPSRLRISDLLGDVTA